MLTHRCILAIVLEFTVSYHILDVVHASGFVRGAQLDVTLVVNIMVVG